jgi:transcriptional regulator with XRE-family HTH domain
MSGRSKKQGPISDSLRVFGENLKIARTAAGLSQDALAQISGRSRSMIYEVEAGARNLSLETAEDLAKALNLPLHTLLQPGGVAVPDAEQTALSTGILPIRPGSLAIELPAAAALESAMHLAKHSGRTIIVIDPESRQIRGTFPKPPSDKQD